MFHIITRTNRSTASRISLHSDSEFFPGVWTVTCDTHTTQRRAYSRTEANRLAAAPRGWCSSCAARPVAATPNRSTARAAARGQRIGNDRRFGVEFEFVGMRRMTVENWLTTSGKRAQGWKVVSDCSVRGTGEGLEMVSPPLRGEAGIEQMREVLQWLNANGADVNRTCGTHVHFDVADIGAQGVARFARSYADNQDLIDWLVAPSRRNNQQYCTRLSNDEVVAIENCVARGSGPQHAAYSRYRTVNVAAFGRHGTVEVRQHQGTLSFDKMVAWVRLGQGMLDTVAETSAPVARQAGVKSLLAAAQVAEDQTAFLLGRAFQFGAPAQVVAA